MTSQAKEHEISISINQLDINESDDGAHLHLRIRLSCSDFCDLRGKIVKFIAPDESEKEIEVTGFNGVENVADDLVVDVPAAPGSYTWKAIFPEQENKGVVHPENSATLSFEYKPHGISMAVWDVPSPLVMGTPFAVKVGVRCSADCKLAGEQFEIVDQAGAEVASGTLGPDPWQQTAALYWAETQMLAPSAEGYYEWTVKFKKSDRDPRHKQATYTLGFATAKPPERTVTVQVVDGDTKAPMPNARVVIHPYWGITDEQGVAKIGVPKGRLEVYISEDGKKIFRLPIEVASDMTLKAELVTLPPDLDG